MLIFTLLSISDVFCQSAKEFLDRGREKIRLYNYGDAITDFSKAVEIDPQDADALFLRGTLKIIIDDCAGGLTDLDKALEIRTSEDSRGVAVKNMNKVITNNTCLYCHLGYAKAKLDDPVTAVFWYDKAIGVDPKRGETWYRKGITEIIIGKKENGCGDLNKAAELGYKQAEIALKNYCR